MALSPDWTLIDYANVNDLQLNEYAQFYPYEKTRGGEEDLEREYIYFCRDDQLPAFIDDLMGYSEWDGVSTLLNRILPDQDKVFKKCYAARWHADEWGAPDKVDGIVTTQTSTGTALYKLQKVTVTYRSRPYQIIPDQQAGTELDRYVIRQPSAGGSYRSLQGRMIFLTKDAQGNQPSLPEPPGLISHEGGISYTWLEVPELVYGQCPIMPTIVAAKGCVNDRLFDPFTVNSVIKGWPAGTLLFDDYEMSRHTSWASPTRGAFWNITYKFKWINNGQGWNFYDPTPFGGDKTDLSLEDNTAGHNYYVNSFISSPRFDLATFNGTKTGYRTYQPYNFIKLFQLPF